MTPFPARRFFPALFGLLTLLVLTGCSSSRPSPTGAGPSSRAGATTSTTETDAARSRVEPRLRAEARAWEGVPHRWGGTDRNGVDCSGLTQAIYADALGLSLPRDTRRQARVGERVRRRDLQPGDLVFFRPSGKERHVGVYLSGGEFVHASSSSGVTVSQLGTDYWQRTWWQARRVLPESGATRPRPAAGPRTESDRPADDRPARGGW